MSQATINDPNALATIREMVDSATAGKVFGTPLTQDGLIVLPVAKVSGGSGPATPAHGDHEQTGVGGGLGLTARPLGVFVIKDGKVGWRPAVDVNKVILGGQLVAITALLVIRALIKVRGRRNAG